MAILEDALKGGNIVTGLAIGVGALVLAPLAVPLLRPITKTFLKAGLVAYDQTRVAVAEMNERASDLVAEARSEMAETAANATPPAPAAKPARTTS
ncbi:DUF5132 domain-containing protein [Sinorhizobium numidicum]|uniref:DUF5132 domain-containing protein n=1 Tax=Sinorhizobium numidicum TaxID=680248 RepID=A0ABY8CVP7_9HYPH|nr:DUF5132 domain-containing protein [Sinorhizobium numidicum]WEX74810.1 DUF5132 domain-containing protein [Sinorhizobium numidicum]WEX80803.1 DUF5132 domain-containing protein [Sinorhizobium numidicum]